MTERIVNWLNNSDFEFDTDDSEDEVRNIINFILLKNIIKYNLTYLFVKFRSMIPILIQNIFQTNSIMKNKI